MEWLLAAVAFFIITLYSGENIGEKNAKKKLHCPAPTIEQCAPFYGKQEYIDKDCFGADKPCLLKIDTKKMEAR